MPGISFYNGSMAILQQNDIAQNLLMLYSFCSCYLARWCRNTMELLGAFVVFFSTLFAVLQKDVVSPSQAGLSVTYALQVSGHEGAA